MKNFSDKGCSSVPLIFVMAPSNESVMFGIPPAESRTAASGGPYDLDMPRLQAKFWVMLTMFIGFLWMIWRMIRQVINAKKREAKFPNGFTADPSLPQV